MTLVLVGHVDESDGMLSLDVFQYHGHMRSRQERRGCGEAV
jgi:hypothetical protein